MNPCSTAAGAQDEKILTISLNPLYSIFKLESYDKPRFQN